MSTERGATILVVTHDTRMIGEVDRVTHLMDGRIVGAEELASNQGEN